MNEYKKSSEIPSKNLVKRIRDIVDCITDCNREKLLSELTMSIPARLDRDADLVLSEVSDRLLRLEEQVKKLSIKAELDDVVGNALEKLGEGYYIEIHIEQGYGGINLCTHSEKRSIEIYSDQDNPLASAINRAIELSKKRS